MVSWGGLRREGDTRPWCSGCFLAVRRDVCTGAGLAAFLSEAQNHCEIESVSCSVVSNSSQPHDCNPPGASVHGILQSRILEWVTISFSGGSP